MDPSCLRPSIISRCLTGIWYDIWGPPYVAHHYYQTPMFDVWCLSLTPMSEVFLWRRWPRTGWYITPPVSSCNLFQRRDLSDRLGRPTWRWVTGCEQCTEVTSHHTFLSAYTWQDQRLGFVATYASSYTFKPLNPYAPFTVSLLHLSISQTFLVLETLSLPLRKPLPSNPNSFKGTFFTSWSLLLYDSNAHNML